MSFTRLVRWAVMAVIIVLVCFFAEANRAQVALSFWPFDVEITAPLALVVLASVIIGVMTGILLCGFSLFKWRHRAKKFQKRIVQLERHAQENKNLGSVSA